MKWSDFIDDFNRKQFWQIENVFGSVEEFLEVMIHKGLIEKLDLNRITGIIDNPNGFLKTLRNYKPEIYEKIILDGFKNEIKEKDGKYFLQLPDLTELSELFCVSTRHSTRDLVTKILDSEEFFEPFFYDYDDISFYDEILDNLTDKQKVYLSEKISEEFKNEQIEPSTSVLEKIADEQGHPNFVKLTKENLLDDIFKDKETFDKIIYNSELRSDLFSIYNNASNDAYEGEIYKKIWNELEEYFADKGEWIYVPSKIDKNKHTSFVEIEIRDFWKIISDYMDVFDTDDDNYNSVVDFYFLDLLKRLIDEGEYPCLDFIIPDYPDYSLTIKNIRELFQEYI